MKPKETQEERYDVSTGVRRRGNYILDVAGLEVRSHIPSFLPVAAGLKAKTAKIAVYAPVVETIDTSATRVKVAKNPYVRGGMTPGAGKNGAVVQSIDRTNADCDEVTLATAFGAEVSIGDTLFGASATGGTTPKAVTNSALYKNRKVTEGISGVAFLMRVFEIEPEKLVILLYAAGRANLPRFQFNEQKEKTRS